MDARDESPAGERADRTRTDEPLPDLMELSLAELRTIEHPVLRDVLTDLRERSARSSEMLWGFGNVIS
jgi:FXSXX-COOH protein